MGVPNNKREQGAVHLAKSLGVDTDGRNGWSVRLNTNKEAAGDYDLWAVATDTIDRTTASPTIAVTISADDGEPPGGGSGKCHPRKDPNCTR